MVRFDAEEDYIAAVTGDPWRVFGSVLMLQAWSPGFNPLCDDIVTTPVWVRISHLPVNFYHRAILMGIAAGLGKPVKVDLTTLRVERARFARVCVEVDLKRPLKGSIMVNGERYFVAYEGLSNICPTCGVYGHTVSACPERLREQLALSSLQENVWAREKGGKDGDGFTEVRGTSRRNAKSPAVVFVAGGSGNQMVDTRVTKSGGSVEAAVVVSNSFGGLECAEDPQEMRDESDMVERNKENVNPQNRSLKEKSGAQGNGRGTVGKQVGEKGGVRGGEIEKINGGNKPGRIMGMRGRSSKPSIPAKGLVFGPLGGEMGNISTRKRLRMEQGSVGREGGVYSARSMGIAEVKGSLQARVEENLVRNGDLADGSKSMDIVPHERRMVVNGGDGDK